MSDDDSWENLSDEQVALLSEGFCPWAEANPHRVGCAKVRDHLTNEVAEYGYCLRYDALVRIVAGKAEVRPIEMFIKNHRRVVEWQT